MDLASRGSDLLHKVKQLLNGPGPGVALGDPRTASLGLEKVNKDSFGVNNFREMCSLKG